MQKIERNDEGETVATEDDWEQASGYDKVADESAERRLRGDKE